MARAALCPHCGEALPERFARRARPRRSSTLIAGRPMPLNAKLRAAFAFIAAEIEAGGAPTFSDIRAAFGLPTNGGAQRRVESLIGLGWLVRRHGVLALTDGAAAKRDASVANTLSRASHARRAA